jgi:hypothetical protein
VRFLKNPRAISWCFLLAAATALYFTHLMALAIAGLALTAYSLVDRRRLRELLLGWALFVPAAGFYLHTEWHLASSWNISYRPLTGKLVGLLVAVLGFSAPLDFFTLSIGGLFWFWACWGNRDFRWRAPWAAAAGLLFALYWIFPSDYGPGLNSDFRLLPFIVVVGLAAVRLGRRLKPLAVVAVMLFLIRATALEFEGTSQRCLGHSSRITRASFGSVRPTNSTGRTPALGFRCDRARLVISLSIPRLRRATTCH